MRRLFAIALVLAVAAALLRYADIATAASAVVHMPRASLLAILALLLAIALARAARWSYYLRSAELRIRRRDAMTSSLGGMSLSWFPGGGLLAARLAQEHGDVRMRQATPALFVRIVADLFVIATLALGFGLSSRHSQDRLLIPICGLVFAGVLVAMGRSSRFWAFIDRLLLRFRLTRSWLSQEVDIQVRVQALMRVRVLATGVLFSLLTTTLSIALLVVLVNGLTVRGITPVEATTVHATAETVSELAPIGIGFTVGDSSLAQMLNGLGIGWTRVIYLLLTLRSLNLLFKTGIGVVTLLFCYRPLLFGALDLPRRRRTTRRWVGHAWRLGRRNSGSH
jgi:putative heme transporter